MFLCKNLFFSISILSIPIMLIGINGGYFPAICRVCFILQWVCFSYQVRLVQVFDLKVKGVLSFSITFCRTTPLKLSLIAFEDMVITIKG